MDKQANILYVEDDLGDIELFKATVEQYQASMSLDIAETVEDAKKQFDVQRHIAAILDWNLPDGDGLEVAEHIRTLSKNTPIIFLSVVFTKELVIKAKDYQAVACIEKEYSEAQIRKICERIGLEKDDVAKKEASPNLLWI